MSSSNVSDPRVGRHGAQEPFHQAHSTPFRLQEDNGALANDPSSSRAAAVAAPVLEDGLGPTFARSDSSTGPSPAPGSTAGPSPPPALAAERGPVGSSQHRAARPGPATPATALCSRLTPGSTQCTVQGSQMRSFHTWIPGWPKGSSQTVRWAAASHASCLRQLFEVWHWQTATLCTLGVYVTPSLWQPAHVQQPHSGCACCAERSQI